MQALPLLRILHAAAAMVVVVTGCLLPGIARAHGDLDLQISVVSLELKQAPTALLYLKRAELHHEHEDFAAALADYDRAAKLDPQLDVIGFNRARTLFRSGQLSPAREALDTYLKKQPRHAEAFRLRARVLVGLKNYAAAVADFDRNLTLASQPQPETFLERADALLATGEKSRAVTSLDQGIERLGNLVTLQSAAIALELDLHRYDAALARVDRVMSSLQRKETWLARRGEILETDGRPEEARRAYRDALGALERLPAQHRNGAPMRALEARLREHLGT
ncbi:MAG: tetratricopeptide repeat protein [Opitutus sp.]